MITPQYGALPATLTPDDVRSVAPAIEKYAQGPVAELWKRDVRAHHSSRVLLWLGECHVGRGDRERRLWQTWHRIRPTAPGLAAAACARRGGGGATGRARSRAVRRRGARDSAVH